MVPALQRAGPGEGRGAEIAGGQGGDWLEKTREAWAQEANRGLEQAGRAERIDCRNLASLRDEAYQAGDLERAAELSREPNVHLGPEGYRTLRRGGASETVEQAGRVERRNAADRASGTQTAGRWSGWRGRSPGSGHS